MLNLVSYFRNIAETLIDFNYSEASGLKVFCRASSVQNIDEFLTSKRYLSNPCMVFLWDGTGKYDAKNAVTTFDTKLFTYFIVKQLRKDDYDAIEQWLNEDIFDIQDKILAKMTYDKRTNENLQFDMNIDYFPVGPIGDNWYGRGFNSSIKAQACLLYNPLDYAAGS